MADRSSGSRRGNNRRLANEERLRALGAEVGQQTGSSRPQRRNARVRHRGRPWIIAGLAALVLVVALGGGGYVYANWRFGQIPKINVVGEVKPIAGQPFNILVVGSDSRAGLSGGLGAQTGAATGQAPGQRSDVVKIVHVDPAKETISIVSIPRDTVVTLLANQSLYGNFNRINVNFANGPSLLAQTITANFGIPIHDTVVVNFVGLINAADALGGVYLDFPFPAKDAYSGLNITHPGCQLIKGFQALAVARSRHYYWYQNGTWNYDGTSDFGRILRQNNFLKAMVIRAKSIYNPLTINSFLSKLPQGVTLDNNFSLSELAGLAVRFHHLNPNSVVAETLPTYSAVSPSLGDVLYVQQPQAQEMLTNIFGSELMTPTNPPPNSLGQTPLPPVVTTTTIPSATSTTGTPTSSSHAVTTTTNPTPATPYFDPVPCNG